MTGSEQVTCGPRWVVPLPMAAGSVTGCVGMQVCWWGIEPPSGTWAVMCWTQMMSPWGLWVHDAGSPATAAHEMPAETTASPPMRPETAAILPLLNM